METGTTQRVFITGLLILSVVISGCSRQFYTALVSSDGDSNRTLANLSALPQSPQFNNGSSSQHTPSKSSDFLEGEKSGQVGQAEPLPEGPPLAHLRDSNPLASLPHRGLTPDGSDHSVQRQGFRNLERQPFASEDEVLAQNGRVGDAAFIPGMKNAGEISFQDRHRGEAYIEQANDSDSSTAFGSEEITPLEDKDLLTEMAAASGTIGSSVLDGNAANSRKKKAAFVPLGNELFSNGNLGDIFFDFDAVAIRLDAESILEKNARILKSRIEDHSVVIEGHCDERGTAEYNLVLGERRAQTTKQYLVDLGVSASAIQIVSYGKEKPFCTGSQPDCWKMNRRGHFVVR